MLDDIKATYGLPPNFSLSNYKDAMNKDYDQTDAAIVKNSVVPVCFGRNYLPPKQDMFDALRGDYEDNIQQIIDYLGEKKKPSKVLDDYYLWLSDKLYIGFDNDIEHLNKYDGGLDAASLAWIKNTKKVIHKYALLTREKLEEATNG
ncbi:MAG: hypothetical protein FWG43_06010 [Clostridiales bacterium]|nr:hypothetical protein [Clostridiales bacterium]